MLPAKIAQIIWTLTAVNIQSLRLSVSPECTNPFTHRSKPAPWLTTGKIWSKCLLRTDIFCSLKLKLWSWSVALFCISWSFWMVFMAKHWKEQIPLTAETAWELKCTPVHEPYWQNGYKLSKIGQTPNFFIPIFLLPANINMVVFTLCWQLAISLMQLYFFLGGLCALLLVGYGAPVIQPNTRGTRPFKLECTEPVLEK